MIDCVGCPRETDRSLTNSFTVKTQKHHRTIRAPSKARYPGTRCQTTWHTFQNSGSIVVICCILWTLSTIEHYCLVKDTTCPQTALVASMCNLSLETNQQLTFGLLNATLRKWHKAPYGCTKLSTLLRWDLMDSMLCAVSFAYLSWGKIGKTINLGLTKWWKVTHDSVTKVSQPGRRNCVQVSS